MSTSLVVLNRFGLGARPGEAARLDDPRGRLIGQIGSPPELAAAPPAPEVMGTSWRAYQEAVRSRDQERVREARRRLAAVNAAEAGNVVTTRVVTERPFAERWVAFWSNHLCVSTGDSFRVAFLAGSYEREVARRHAFGRFEEMLLASARHPAMLVYLDNVRSMGPKSEAARRRGRGRGAAREAPLGLNENYARELLELHTVGVEGGYTQEDVEELARILTGWTLQGGGGARGGGGRAPESFAFRPQLHEPGSKRVLGRRYPEGEEGGLTLIRDLARHPSTARFIAGKLATHFIDDAPPAPVVDALAARWSETEGDLAEVAGELVRHDATWHADYRKFRTPQDWVVAALRATGVREVAPNVPLVLRQLRHQLWAPPSPKGYGDLRREWADPDSLMNRAELARTLGERAGAGRGEGRGRRRGRSAPDIRPLASVMTLAEDDPLLPLLADDSIPLDERVALVFAGPAFQWR